MKRKESNNLINFQSVKSIKDLAILANDKIGELEHALYSILDCDRIDVIKEIAADALGEDIDIYLEDEMDKKLELNFEHEDNDN